MAALWNACRQYSTSAEKNVNVKEILRLRQRHFLLPSRKLSSGGVNSRCGKQKTPWRKPECSGSGSYNQRFKNLLEIV